MTTQSELAPQSHDTPDTATSPDGLTREEVRNRLEQYGYNELPETKENPLLKFLSYFWGPIPWMIEAAAILSAAVAHWVDLCIILVLLVANAIIGFWEEFQAGNAIAALKQKLALRARVMREGQWSTVPARELVPGDLVRLRIGDVVPADGKLLHGDPIYVDQSSLTGESLPVTRKTGEVVYAGSVVKQGEIEAQVEATGKSTYFGKTAHLIETAQAKSHFQRAVLKIGDYLIVLAVVLVSLILIVALFRGDPMATTLQFALVLTVAAVPVALPTVLSVTMAVGARILARSQAIVSRLASIEELAGMDVLCTDKTGTLTQNKLTLNEPFLIEGVTRGQAILSAALASRAEDQDPIDLAVIGGLTADEDMTGYEIVHFRPFDPVHKRTEATVIAPCVANDRGRSPVFQPSGSDPRIDSAKINKPADGSRFKVTKGAPQVILDMSANADEVRVAVDEAVDRFAARGFRSLGVARTDERGQWQFQAVLPLYDPPREDSKQTIKLARQMGARVMMITGDQLAIAKETARQLDLGTDILDAGLFDETKGHQLGQLSDLIENADGFAQVYPEHKYHVVDVLQQHGHVVGMTGDGVNDAPALKKAEVGIAVSGATDAARAAADIVLLSPGLSVIINAITESRRIFQRMTNYAIYRIAETIRVLLFMTLAILVFNFYPVTAVMIVLLALLNDGAILSIAFDRVKASDQPETWNMRTVLGVATVLGIVGVAESFGLFYLVERYFGLQQDVIQSMMYLKLSVAGHLTVFVARTRGPFWSIRPAKSLFWAVVGTQAVATLIAVNGIFMAPIGWGWAAFVWGFALAGFLLEDLAKLAAYRILDPLKPDVLTEARRCGARR